MAPARRRRYLNKAERTALLTQWHDQGLDIDEIARRFRADADAGGLESYRLANNLSQLAVALLYNPDQGSATAQVVSRWEHWPNGHNPIQPSLLVLQRLATIYHTTRANLVAAIDERPPHHALQQAAAATWADGDVMESRTSASDVAPRSPLPGSELQLGPEPISRQSGPPAASSTMMRDDRGFDSGLSLDNHGRNVDRRSAIDAMVVALGATLLEFTGSLRRSNVGERMLTYIEADAVRFGTQYPELAPGRLLAPVRQTFEVASRYLSGTQPIGHRRRLARATAQLATVAGMTLFNLGSQQQAQWAFRAAGEAAAEAEDDLLGAWVLASECIIATYNDDPSGVLELTARGHRLAAGTRSVVIAKLAALEAKAHASLGNQPAAQDALAQARRAMNTAAAEEFRAGPFGFTPAKHAFYEGTCYVRLALPDAALAASQQALDLYQSTKAFMDPTIARIDLAIAYSQKGEIEGACQLGEQFAAIPPSLRTDPIKARAAEFLGGLQPRHRTLPAVQDLRERLALEPPDSHRDEHP